MKYKYFSALTVSLLVLAACSGRSPSASDIGGRELRPPKSGIQIGSLYYVREEQSQSLDEPANLVKLCMFDLSNAGVSLGAPQNVADIDLLGKLDASGELDAIKLDLVSAGVSGGLTDNFSYKLTNAKELSLSLVEADRIFESQAFRKSCSGWRKSINNKGFAAYQIQSIIFGDLAFGYSREIAGNAEAKASLRVWEPKLEAAIKRLYGGSYEGKGLVVSFQPINRF